MEPILFIIICWIILISFISIIVTIWDKYSAVSHRRRIRERTLLILAALGGSVAMYITMQLIRHKTTKLKFMLGIPLIFIAQLGIAVFIILVKNNVFG